MAPVPLELDRGIRLAIANRRLLRLTYHTRTRTVEPHDYGLIAGDAKLFAYQRYEEGRTRPPGWRLFTVNSIAALDVLDTEFAGSRDADQDHRFHWNPLLCRVR